MKHLPSRPWSDTTEHVLRTLESTPKDGLASAEAKQRLQDFGQNIFETTQSKGPLSIFINQFVSPLIIILRWPQPYKHG